MKQLLITSVAVVGMFLVASGSSEAGGHGYHGGSGYFGGHGCNTGYGYGWGGSYTPVYQTYPSFGYPQWHNTSHWDYHPGGYVPHGNHVDYVPGHWDYHQTGHLHY